MASILVPPRSIPMRSGTPRAYNPAMSRRRFLKASAVIGAAVASNVASGAFAAAGEALGQAAPSRSEAKTGAPRSATGRPIRILLAGYAPPSNRFSLSLKPIGERVQNKFGKDVDVKYLFNILDLGYKRSEEHTSELQSRG